MRPFCLFLTSAAAVIVALGKSDFDTAAAAARAKPSSAVPADIASSDPGCGKWSLAACTSALTIRPPGPLPESEAMSTPVSRATRRASGEALTRSPGELAAGSGEAAGAGGVLFLRG